MHYTCPYTSTHNLTGERVVIPDRRTCVPTGLSLNGALFISPKEHLDALVSPSTKLLYYTPRVRQDTLESHADPFLEVIFMSVRYYSEGY